MSFFEENNILDVNQGGFRKNNSTTETTASMPDDLYNNIKIQQLTITIFIDFRKAFDSIDHEILLQKLAKLGFHENSIKWYKNYLANQTQYTVVNGIEPSRLDLTFEVPQGLVLKPMLYLLFINDMGSAIIHSSYKLYADGTVLYSKCTGEDNAGLYTSMQQDLSAVVN